MAYAKFSLPAGTEQHGLKLLQCYGTIKVPITIPVNTQVHVHMPYQFKSSVDTKNIVFRIVNNSNHESYVIDIVLSSPPHAVSGTYSSIKPTQKEIPKNTVVQINLSVMTTNNFSSSDYLRWLSNSYNYIRFGSFTFVVVGDLIKSTDFTAVNQTATIGEKITNSNFTSDTIITADEWNAKWI